MSSSCMGCWCLNPSLVGLRKEQEHVPVSENVGALGCQARHTFLQRVQRGANLLS